MVLLTIATSDCTPQTIVIGRRGTYETMQIAFDLSYLVQSYGNGVAVLAVKRSQDAAAYPATITQDGNTLTWTVSETDTYYVGAGECQLMWYVNNGLAKTIIYPVVVMRDILSTAEEPPDGYENWVESLTELGAETLQNAQEAAQSATEAEASAEAAAESEEKAKDAADLLENVSATATTLEPGQPATAEYDDGIFKFGIPKGDKLTYADLTEADKEDLVQGPIKEAQDDAVEAVGTAKTNAVEAVNTAGTTQKNAVNEAGTTQKNAVNQAGTSAVNAVNQAGETQVDNVQTEGAIQVQAVEDKGDEVIDSIPSDYSDLTAEVDNLSRQLSDMLTVSQSDNRLDPNSQIDADINTTTGVVTQNDYYSVSGKMPCEYGESLYVVEKDDLTNLQSAAIRMAFYTSGDSFIEIQQNVSPFVVPQNAAYCLLRSNKNQIIQEKFGVFPYSGATMSAWIPYSVTKTLSDDYVPLELASEVANNTAKTALIIVACGENLLETFELSQVGANNLRSNRFPVKAGVTYTFCYGGAVDNTTAGYVECYEAGSTYREQVVSFPFKQGFVTFTPQENIVEADLYFYNTNGMSVDTFTLTDPLLVYGLQQVGYTPYKEKLAASTIPTLPDRLYTNEFSAIKSVAHMGQSYYFPQNTIWSWLGAKKSGFDYIECDLQVTADNQIVLIHDPDMRRYGGTAAQTVASLTLAQLREFDAGAWFNKAYTGTVFPLFDEMVGVAKALGMKLALDCKTIDTAERVDAVATILEKWGMVDEAYWITGNFSLVWNRLPDAEICFAAGATLIEGSFADTAGGWFNNYASNFPADHRQQKTVTIDVNGTQTEVTGYVAAEGVKFAVAQNYTVGDTYGLSSLQKEAEYAKAFGVKYELYAVDSDEAIYNYVQNIPELYSITSNRTTVQAATCRKFGIGLSDRPQNIGETDFA